MSLSPIVVTHGGVGGKASDSDGCEQAGALGLARMAAGEDALAAALAAAVRLEDDGRYNAGTGACLRLDGETLETDASLMDSRGRMAAVAALVGFKNPILVARQVAETPHIMLAGAGAIAFARCHDFEAHPGPTEAARRRWREVVEAMGRGDFSDIQDGWRSFDLDRNWNFPKPREECMLALTSTIGAVAMDAEGHFAVCNSTGGSSPMLCGRIGDTPLPGCGYWAGEHGAVACTGIGEAIIRKLLSRTVHDWLAAGVAPQEACERGVRLFPQEVPIGLIAVSRQGGGSANNREMPTAICRA